MKKMERMVGFEKGKIYLTFVNILHGNIGIILIQMQACLTLKKCFQQFLSRRNFGYNNYR